MTQPDSITKSREIFNGFGNDVTKDGTDGSDGWMPIGGRVDALRGLSEHR